MKCSIPGTLSLETLSENCIYNTWISRILKVCFWNLEAPRPQGDQCILDQLPQLQIVTFVVLLCWNDFSLKSLIILLNMPFLLIQLVSNMESIRNQCFEINLQIFFEDMDENINYDFWLTFHRLSTIITKICSIYWFCTYPLLNA